MAELVDAPDLKSVGRKAVPVQVRLPAPAFVLTELRLGKPASLAQLFALFETNTRKLDAGLGQLQALHPRNFATGG